MASTGGNAPPIFADNVKFNGTNWVSWNGLIRIAADLRGISGYLDGSIPDPAAVINPLTIPLPPTPSATAASAPAPPPSGPIVESPWESTTPSPSEWKVRNAWALGLLIYNTNDPIGLGINIQGTAADAWKLYIDNYQVASEVAILNADTELRNMTYNDGQDFVDFISRMRTKWTNATALGANIDDKSFRMIILRALPRSWDPIVATLYNTTTSRDAINQLMAHWARISQDRVSNPQTTTSALQANVNRNRDRQQWQNSNLQCTNSNCGRRGHTIENCYWPGGGKAGQFPPGFGKRRGNRGGNPSTSGNQTTASANTATTEATNTTKPQVFALAAITEWNDGEKTEPMPEVTSNNTSAPIPTPILPSNDILTLLDSGASDHCFVKQSLFSHYKPISPSQTGQSAGKDSTFSIKGVGTSSFSTTTGERTLKVTMDGTLHTPNLRSNLISVSKLVSRGSKISFEGETAVVRNAGGTVVFTANRINGLYVIPVIESSISTAEAHAVQAKRKGVTFDIWHRRFGHISTKIIARMVQEKLVDGLNASGTTALDGLCEDCIYGKHTTHPFNDDIPPEKQPLERVYIDIWGPSPVASAGGAHYFMLVVDGATSFRRVFFLSSKSAAATMEVFKHFHTEAERQTGMKLKRVRLDMGREWHNATWDEYVKTHGIILDFATPYAHQQNRRAERSMRTLLDMARAMLADSGLPQKYWADAVQTAVYIRNFVPASREPLAIPAERWHGRRQDISHLRLFGSTSYAHIPVEVSPSKLSPRSAKLTLIGYYDRSGYKLLDRATGRVHKSRDVIFEETKPHYSTDPLMAYPLDNGRATSYPLAAPRPQPISSLHQPPTPKLPTSTASIPTQQTIPAPTLGAVDPNAEKTDSEGEVAGILQPTDVDDAPIAIRRSKREVKPSDKMRQSLEYLNRTRANMADVGGDMLDDETRVPRSFNEAMKQPDIWFQPMIRELQVMKEKEVYRLVPRPIDKNVVQSKWVFANKYDEAGDISGRKARLVAKGFTQILGEDYDETYASVARLELVRLVCAIAASRGLRLWQVDFVSAFLNSVNTFEVYMEQPPGFEEAGEDQVWLLLKTLYGTMQGAHDWARTLERTYQGHGYYTSKADPQVRSRTSNNKITLTSTWTDDILGASSTETGEVKAKDELKRSHELKDLGTAKFILGMKIVTDDEGNIHLSQRAYINRILDRFNMNDAKPRSTPLPAGITLTTADAPQTADEILDMKDVPYREALGSLMWLQVATRPDLSFAVNLLSRFTNNPGRAHWNALKYTLAYLKATAHYSITYFHNASLQPFGYVDADYAGDIDSSRSTEGHIFFVAGGPVSWASKRQETVALSTVEAEYTAFTHQQN